MATLTRGQTFGSSETVTNTKLHNLVDLGGVSNIVDADCSPSMNLSDTKLADITTGNKVRGSALGNLASIPSSAGLIPSANIPSILPITLPSMVDGAAMRNIQSMPSLAGQLSYYSIVSSLASGGTVRFNGVDKFIGAPAIGGWVPNGIDVFTASGTWTKPANVSSVYVKVLGAGGGGAGTGSSGAQRAGGGAGGYAEGVVSVTGNVTVTVGTGGSGAANEVATATSGGLSSFAGSTTVTGNGGSGATGSTGGTGGSATNGNINITGGSGVNGVATASIPTNPSAGTGGVPYGSSGVPGMPVPTEYNGQNAYGYGYGGGGARSTGSNNFTGGSGANGIVIVYY